MAPDLPSHSTCNRNRLLASNSYTLLYDEKHDNGALIKITCSKMSEQNRRSRTTELL